MKLGKCFCENYFSGRLFVIVIRNLSLFLFGLNFKGFALGKVFAIIAAVFLLASCIKTYSRDTSITEMIVCFITTWLPLQMDTFVGASFSMIRLSVLGLLKWSLMNFGDLISQSIDCICISCIETLNLAQAKKKGCILSGPVLKMQEITLSVVSS